MIRQRYRDVRQKHKPCKQVQVRNPQDKTQKQAGYKAGMSDLANNRGKLTGINTEGRMS